MTDLYHVQKRDGICDVCGSDCCGSEHVIWEEHGEDEMLARASHALQEALIDYICQSQMFDRCDRNNFDNARAEIASSIDDAIELLRQRRAVGSPPGALKGKERIR